MASFFCPFCKKELTIINSIKVSDIIHKNAWSGQSVPCCVEPIIKRKTESALKIKGITLGKEYHKYACYECGYTHDGIAGACTLF